MPPKSAEEQKSSVKISGEFYKKLLTDKAAKTDDLIKEFGSLLKDYKDFREDAERKKIFLDLIVKKIGDLTESGFASALNQITTIAKNYSISIESDIFDKKIATLNAQRISINCLISILSGLSNAGFGEENLRESRGFFIAALNRFANAGNHDENSIECSVHFLLHIKNLGFINDQSLKGLVSEVLQKISDFYSQEDVGSRILRPLCEVAIYCRDVLGVKIPQNLEDKLAEQWSDKDQSITSFLQRNVFADLQKYLETKGEWKHIKKQLAPNICAIGNFTIELEGGYGLIGSDKLKAIKYGDIVVRNGDKKIVAIVEVDGPSHYSIINGKRTYVASSKARNEYIAKLVGADGLVCIDYQEYEKSLSSGDEKKKYFDDKFAFIDELLQRKMQEDKAASAGKSAPSFAEAEVALPSKQQKDLEPEGPEALASEGAVAAESKKKKRIPVPELAQQLFNLLTMEGNFDLDEIARFLVRHQKNAVGIVSSTQADKKSPMEIAIDLYLRNPSDYYADLIVLLRVYGFDALPKAYEKPVEELCPSNFFALMGWSGKSKESSKKTGVAAKDSGSLGFSDRRRKIIEIIKGDVSKSAMIKALSSTVSSGDYSLTKIALDCFFEDGVKIENGNSFFELVIIAIATKRNDILFLLIDRIKEMTVSGKFIMSGKKCADGEVISVIALLAVSNNFDAIKFLIDTGYDINSDGDLKKVVIRSIAVSDIKCLNFF